MLRLRFLRILLPVVLIACVGLLLVTLRQRPQALGTPEATGSESPSLVKNFHIRELEGAAVSLEARGESAERDDDGRYHMTHIKELKVNRVDKSPLLISADLGVIEGEAGARQMRLDGGVSVLDPADGLQLQLPALEVDESAAEARSDGALTFGSDNTSGSASSLVYRLDRRPSLLTDPVMHDAAGGEFGAELAILHDGLDDVELRGAVRVQQPGQSLEAGSLRLWRDELARPVRAEARSGVTGRLVAGDGPNLGFRAEAAGIGWDQERAVDQLELTDQAELSNASGTLSAERILVRRAAVDPPLWRFEASGTVFLQSQPPTGATAWLRADAVTAEQSADQELSWVEARGSVRIEAPDTAAESDAARFEPGRSPFEITLFSEDGRRARVANGRSRVSAVRIEMNRAGSQMIAEERVEASLLGDAAAAGVGLFRADSAVHFVSSRLEVEAAGARLIFTDAVRGWQGERNLAAERVEWDRADGTLTAREHVTTRIPRQQDRSGGAESDYIQISAELLTFSETTRVAVFTDAVRVRLAEGWLEADRVEIDLGQQGEGIRQLLASDNVRVEFRDDRDADPLLLTGDADRLLFLPQEETVRLFGDRAPASMRRVGALGGTTKGRVLRYRLDSGTLEVESGEGNPPARIQTKTD